MTKYNVTHSQAVWECCFFTVEVPDGVEDPQEWIENNLNDLLREAFNRDEVETSTDSSVDGIDATTEIEEVTD